MPPNSWTREFFLPAPDAALQIFKTTSSQSPTIAPPGPNLTQLHHNTAEKTIQTEGITAAHGFISLHVEEIPVEVVCLL